jgi:hypothetical protein
VDEVPQLLGLPVLTTIPYTPSAAGLAAVSSEQLLGEA